MQEPIRVLCVFSTLNRGGAESMCMNLYRHMDRSKVQFDFVKHTEDIGEFEDEIIDLGGIIYTAPRYKVYNHLKYVAWWKKHLKEHPEYRIIHGHFFSISAVYFCVAKKEGRITVGHSHIAKFDGRIKKLYTNPVEKLADYRLACGKEAGKLLYPHRDFIVLKNAIEADKFRPNKTIRDEYRQQLKITNKYVIGIVANISDHKNPLGVIEIFNEVHKRRPDSVLLWIGSGDMRDKVESLIEKYDLGKSVFLLGVRADVNNLLQAIDVFILPSLYEGLPVVLIEAQASGLKCLVSDTVTREADITGRCIYLNNKSPKLWAEKICSLDTTRIDTYDKICSAGYDVNTSAMWLQKFYQEISRGDF